MINRMGDISSWAAKSSNSSRNGEEELSGHPVDGGDIEMGRVQEEHPSSMSYVFEQVETIKSSIQAVKEASTKIARLSKEAIHATTMEKEKDLSKQLNLIVNKANKEAKRTKDLLGLLKEETKKLKEEGNLKVSDERYVTWTFLGKSY